MNNPALEVIDIEEEEDKETKLREAYEILSYKQDVILNKIRKRANKSSAK